MRRYVKSVKDHMELPLDAPLDSVRPPLPVGEAMLMLVQIAGNIRELHAANIRMQDLKPGNLLIDGKGDIFLSDFGLAHLIVQTMPQTAATSGGGTPNYSAPELLDTELSAGPTEKIDVWAFACVAYELLTGRVPWQGKSPHQILMSVVVRKVVLELPAGTEAPADMPAFLGHCLAYEPTERPTAAEMERRIIEMAAPWLAPPAAVVAGGVGGATVPAEQLEELRTNLTKAFEQQMARQQQAQQAQILALQQQLQAQQQATQAQQQAIQVQAADAQQQLAVEKQALQAEFQENLGNLSRQLQEDTQRRILKHAAVQSAGSAAISPAVTGWLQQLDSELQQQQQMVPEPEPQALSPALAAQSATAAAGGTDPLRAEMEKHGLSTADQAALIQDGVATLQVFRQIDDANFKLSGIDIAARRAAKAAADQAAADATGVRDLLQREGGAISPAGQAAIIKARAP